MYIHTHVGISTFTEDAYFPHLRQGPEKKFSLKTMIKLYK